jgi:predicted glycoside hydrolase/deacetylase ChbG (UPF0249 family)
VLVRVEHDDSVGQGEARVVGLEGRTVHFLHTHTQITLFPSIYTSTAELQALFQV